MTKELNAYDLKINEVIYALKPTQYNEKTLFIDGVETKVLAYSGSQWIKGKFKGMPNGTSGFYFHTEREIDGGLYLMDIETRIKYPATANDMIKES